MSETGGLGHIRQYALQRKIGEGGMGVVFEAFDSQLERRVAIKMIREEEVGDESQRRRLLREARVAAGINHPNICHVYDVGEETGELYIVMELLEGKPLSDQIADGVLPVDKALETTLGILSALEALHHQGIIHRDLKPSNVFITRHGIKLLDFGLARAHQADAKSLDITQPGSVLGTPRYMAPEQWAGMDLAAPADLFALGAILQEMISGRPAFEGESILEVCNAIANTEPRFLEGEAFAPANRVIQRALAKKPGDRFQTAEAMTEAVRGALRAADSGPRTTRVKKHLMVLPFRMLRPDPDIEFLAFSLPDAIIVSLSNLESLVVRSSATAGTFQDATHDLKRMAEEVGVDAVLFGSLLRAGDQVRLTIQLVEAPGGSVLVSKAVQVSLQDMLQVQDDLVSEILESLSITLSPRDSNRLKRDVPDSAMVYERYLRANQFGNNRRLLDEARDLYKLCLEEDPNYAPAWARLGRVYRVMAKYETSGDSAENFRLAQEAFNKALAIDPDLSMAHNLYTYLEVEELGRAKEAMVRLVERALSRPSDSELFAGLVLTCRFCGLLDTSVAADRQARRLNPGIQTSVQYTYLMLEDYERAMAYDTDDMRWAVNYAMFLNGQEEEAIKGYRLIEGSELGGLERYVATITRAGGERNHDECVAAADILMDSRFHDPEGRFFGARALARVGEHERSLDVLEQIVAKAFTIPRAMVNDPWLAELRGMDRFHSILEDARTRHRDAVAAFKSAGGERLLGPVQEMV